MTNLVVIGSLYILFLDGRTSQMTDTPLYVAQYALFNIYLFVVTILYSPTGENTDRKFPGLIGQLSNIFSMKNTDQLPVQISEEDKVELGKLNTQSVKKRKIGKETNLDE